MISLVLISVAMSNCIQDPVPAPVNPPVPVVEEADERFFVGATADQKLFIEGARQAINESDDLNRIQKFVLKRRLNKKRFVELLMAEYRADLMLESPDGRPVAIDWGDVDWSKMIELAILLIKLFA